MQNNKQQTIEEFMINKKLLDTKLKTMYGNKEITLEVCEMTNILR